MTTSTLFPPAVDQAHNVFSSRVNQLDSLFKPQNIAVVGATEKIGSVGRTILWNLMSTSFGGTLYPVNPKRDNVLGIKAYRSLRDIPDKIDLVVVVTPAATIPAIIEEAGELGVPGAIIISAGFKEVGPEGVAREQAILETAKKTGMRIIGPNCLGVMNTTSGLNATFASGMANPGHVGFLSQSGALCTAVLDWSLTNNVGFSVFASIGSMLDVDWGDLIYYLADDPNTHSIVIYMETIGNAESFISAAREVALEKPIIVIKPGRTESAAQAAASHTGSLVGSDAVMDAAFRRCGVLRVETIEELFAMADVLGKQPLPKGPKLNIVTNAGGPGVIATDALIRSGGELAPVSDQTMSALNQILPEAWSHNNPIDVLGDASPERYAETLNIVNENDTADGTLVILTPQAMTHPRETARALASSLKNAKGANDKPVMASWMGGNDVLAGMDVLNRANIPTFLYPDTAARSFSMMWQYRRNLDSLYETPDYCEQDSLAHVDRDGIKATLQAALAEGRDTLTEFESKDLLAQYGIPTTRTIIAKTADDAAQAADELGYPVVVKLHSNTITHKSDVGGVQLNLKNADAVRQAVETIQKNLETRNLSDGFDGVTVQPMVSAKGIELLIGSTSDPQFGPVVAFGAGGTMVELFEDVNFGLPPLNTTLVSRLMERTKIAKALEGIRGAEPVDIKALEALLVRFSYLVINHPEIKEVEINPLLAMPGDAGLMALDARIILHDKADLDSGSVQRNVIRSYPYEYCQELTVKGDEAVSLRPIRASDEEGIRQFHQRLTDTDVYRFFNQHMSYAERTNHQRLARVCFNDYTREMSMVAVNQQNDIVGVGRLSRQRMQPDTARFRLVIQDDYHRKGLGKQLMQALLRIAETEGIALVTGTVQEDNDAMLSLTQSLGFETKGQHDGLCLIEKGITSVTSLKKEAVLETV